MNTLLELFTQGFYDDVAFAMAWWIPLAASGVSAGINALADRGKRRQAARQANRRRTQADQALETVQTGIGSLRETAEGIPQNQSVTDLYGDVMQMMTDRVGADQGAAMTNVFRQMMGAGGDISGTGAGMLQGLQQQGQRSISDIIGQFTQMADRRNLQSEARADRLQTSALGAETGLFQALEQLFGAEQLRGDQMGQANKQFGLDLLGVGTSLAGQLYGD